jgi:ubiquitin carboxyl-terminal hydrolase 7
VSNNKTFRLEEIPAEELEVGEGELLVPVAHFNKEVYTTFGSPFILKIKQVIPPPSPPPTPSFTQG